MTAAKKIEIKMTETITASDTPADIAGKREALLKSLGRYGVKAEEAEITEGWGPHGRMLVGVGIGDPIVMTEDMESKRIQENAALGAEVLARLAQLPTLPQLASDAGPAAVPSGMTVDEFSKARDEIEKVNAETASMLAQMQEMRDELAAQREEIEAERAKLASLRADAGPLTGGVTSATTNAITDTASDGVSSPAGDANADPKSDLKKGGAKK
jgi:hypothetical protein